MEERVEEAWREGRHRLTHHDDDDDDVFELSTSADPPTPTDPSPLMGSSPTPPPPGEESAGLLTLLSLGSGCDSGYVPSPSSAASFTFSSDEDEPAVPECHRPGVTPPITIPTVRRRCVRRPVSRPAPSPPPAKPTATPPRDCRPVQRPRAQSLSEQSLHPAPPRTPIPRFPEGVSATPSHGRTCSMPATGPQGQVLLTPPLQPQPATPRGSRDALVDLTGEYGSQSRKHRRRVLVWALPDLVVDAQEQDSGPNIMAPSCAHSSPTFHNLRMRHRSLSCDVTLVEEVGRELRRIADTFFGK